ncbi:ABC transporter permease [Neorhizobium galegae]|jgi:peptide/nickel transport system permease protein|uniref:ABC transporter permease n=1 Tax=Neorhizobium galegae TaxID=399 RepID=UPI000621B940|nr:ABC transporter permease [Neorhizobium galegae]CDZ46516.1 Dipeptide transport system permease protein [Neorhizobium galegae bv. orientalis]
MAAPQSKPIHRHWFNPSIARYMEAFTTTRGIAALTVIILISALAFLAPLIFPGGYDIQSRESLRAPSFVHFFGTDELGRDLFVRSIYGLRSDLTLVYCAVPVSIVAGTLLGLIGAVSPRLGNFVQRCLDIIVGFPGLILGICVVLVLGAGWTALLVAIVISGLPSFGRLARATLLAQQQREYVIAARTLGVGKWQIMVRHILPNAIDPIIVQGAVFVVSAIFIEAALSIVGLGLQPPEPSLGTLLNNGMRYISRAPTYVLGPTVILILVALAFSMLADALNATVNRK